jgi:1,4-alpha-glucan branching enzyme
MIGQPPRQKGEGFDVREQARWYEDIYRYLKKQSFTTSEGSGTTTVENVTKNYGSMTTTITETSKRYLRWMGI